MTTTTTTPRHPAKFSPLILDLLGGLIPPGSRVLDPFAGTGRIHQLADRCGVETVGIEIEPEWAGMNRRTLIGDATALPFVTDSFDVVATSPCYGNRLADHHEARDGSVRHSYTHDLGRRLHPNNAGQLHWGEAYRSLHARAWGEVRRVLVPDGLFLLNISNHIRKGEEVPVVAWHLGVLRELGFSLGDLIEVPTPRLRFGANPCRRLRVFCLECARHVPMGITYPRPLPWTGMGRKR